MKRLTATGRVWGEPEVEAACAAVRAGHDADVVADGRCYTCRESGY